MIDKELLNDKLLPLLKSEGYRASKLSAWVDPTKSPTPLVKATAKPEHRVLSELASTPWLSLVVESLVQALRVTGYRSTEDFNAGNDPSWSAWQANQMDVRQIALHREVMSFGQGFVSALPGASLTGDTRAVFRGWSAKHMVAVYSDPIADEYPQYALGQDKDTYILIDDEAKHYYTLKNGTLTLDRSIPHNLGVCPVVRYINNTDLCGNIVGEIEPYIPLAERINKTSYDRLLIQHFNSWKVRYATGLDIPESASDQQTMAMKLAHDDILIAEDFEARFGTLPETPLAGIIDATTEDLKTLAAVTQTPLYALTGNVSNLSADAIVASRSAFVQKCASRKASLGASHAQLLRLSAFIEGNEQSASNYNAKVTWDNVEPVSLAQIADAASKLQPLGTPQEVLFAMLPGVTDAEALSWVKNAPLPSIGTAS